MEQIRVLIAIGLSFLVFLLWDVIFLKNNQNQKVTQNQNIEETKESVGVPNIEKNQIKKDFIHEQDSSEYKAIEKNINEEGAIISIDTPLYIVKIDEVGGKIVSFILKNYRENASKDSPLKELISLDHGMGSSINFFQDLTNRENIQSALFQADTNKEFLEVKNSSKTIVFTTVRDGGVEIKKIFRFSPDSYLIQLDIEIFNSSDKEVQRTLGTSVRKFIENPEKAYGFVGPSALVNGSRKEIDIDDLKEGVELNGDVRWVGIETIYFLTSIIPENEKDLTVRAKEIENKVIETSIIEKGRKIASGERIKYEYQIYLGPKSLKILSELEHGLEKAVDFGFFDIIAKPCLWLMNYIYQYIPNYGVAIIILTIFIKILLWPLGNKSYKSMNDMKKLQPLVNEIREKYKNDKKKMNQELMELYRVYKVNPMGGCLPMLLQIPVFIAFYRMLYEAIELRHAPFFGWINDLSAPDRLFRFDFAIPLMEPPYGIPVLTLLMGATMFIQQKMSPPPGDPSQAKIMMLMPIIFTVIFINFSSGLVLYWLVNNLLSIGQQYYVYKKRS